MVTAFTAGSSPDNWLSTVESALFSSLLPGNLFIARSFLQVIQFVLVFLNIYEADLMPWCFLLFNTVARIIHSPFSSWIYTISPFSNTSCSLKFLFILSVILSLPSTLFFLSSEESISLWGIVASPGKRGALCRNNSAGDPLLSGRCSQFILWQTVLIPFGVPSKCCIVCFMCFTAASTSPFDCGEYAAFLVRV